ncbi:hypothetical protein CHARACLAT_029508 [Characodon lateralis]|uniref:Uncharacterized protein n=1 Tax=Characodon lateralis TaxID=208331 RepID=A0ABU7CT28_9TELE|nr:hypothetical protein [Characodon lateralis]
MTEQEKYRERMRMFEEDKRIRADQEAAAMSQRLLEEKEEIERKLKREEEKAAVLWRQEESASRKRSVEDLKREIKSLEHLKQFNAAKAKLQVYEEDYLSVKQESIMLNPAYVQVAKFKITASQPSQPLRVKCNS